MTAPSSPLSKLPLLLLTLLLMPAAGLAATQEPSTEEEASAPTQEQEEVEAPELQEHDNLRLLDESELPAPRKERAPLGGRLLAELGLGLVAGAAGLYGGAITGQLLSCNGSGLGPCIMGGVWGGALGATLGVSLGAWAGGSLTGADGHYGYTLLGSALGSALSVLMVMSLNPVLTVLAAVPPLVGALIGYEASVSPEPVSVALGRTRLQPLLSVSPRGAFVGLGGHF